MQSRSMQRRARESKSSAFPKGHSMDEQRLIGKWVQKSPAQEEERLQKEKQ